MSTQEWQPIESAPKDGTSVLLLVNNFAIEGLWCQPVDRNRRPFWDIATIIAVHGCGCCGGDNPEPTHWMPLPPLPGEKP